MDEQALSRFVDQVLADAERAFGEDADAALLERYAHEVVLDLWFAGPMVTVSAARLALSRLRDVIERRTGRDEALLAA